MRESMIEPLQAMEVVQGEIGSDDPLIEPIMQDPAYGL